VRTLGALMLLTVILAGCRSHHEADKGERDTKGRSAAVVRGDVIRDAGAEAEAGHVRDPALVENGPVTLAWTGVVKQSTGKAPAVGTSCTMTADVTVTAEYQPRKRHVVVACGTSSLYDSNASMGGVGQTDFRLFENPVGGKIGVFDYKLKASDVGTRTGDRNQMTVSTSDRELIVYREISPTFRVTINLATAAPQREGKPLWESEIPPFRQVVTVKATMDSSTGTLPFTGKTCDVVFSPGTATHNCRVQVTCGGKLVFGLGTSGFESCFMRDDIPFRIIDAEPTPVDSDPILTVDTSDKTMALSDKLANGATYSAQFHLE
jgi:hypothetical protein